MIRLAVAEALIAIGLWFDQLAQWCLDRADRLVDQVADDVDVGG